jgi:hypothetical protein
VLVLACVAALAASARPDAAPAAAASACEVRVNPGDAVRRAVADASQGARICFAAGSYRLRGPLRPRAGQVLDGGGHATLLGSKRLGDFHRKGDLWVATGQDQRGWRSGECRPSVHDACRYPDAVYRDGRPLHRVTTKRALGRRSFYSDYRHRRIFLAADPRHHDLEAANSEAAIAARPGAAGEGVTVREFRVMMFATPAQHGAIVASANDWVIANNQVLLNHGAGISSENPVTIANNRIVRNGQEGTAGAGSHITVTGNVISHNGWAGFDPNWEAGGAKWAEADHLLIADNTVADNRGPGLWDDIDSRDVTYIGNVARDNDRPGIFHEIGGRARIVGNRVTGNGFAKPVWLWGSGILLAASHDVLVARNTLHRNADAIGLIQQDRGNDPQGHRRYLHDIDVRDNHVALGRGETGLVQDIGDHSVFRDPSITYESNTYEQSRGTPFLWNDNDLTVGEWRALGHDVDGIFLP